MITIDLGESILELTLEEYEALKRYFQPAIVPNTWPPYEDPNKITAPWPPRDTIIWCTKSC